MVRSTKWDARDYATWIARLIPQFCGTFGIFSIGNVNLWYTVYNLPEEPMAFSWDVSYGEILFLCIHCWIWFAGIFVVEHSRKIFKNCYKNKDGLAKNITDADEGAEELNKDQDVAQEEENVKGSNEYQIKVQNLRKVYSITTDAGCCNKGRNITYKVAVKNVTFGVKKGDCFCMLGTNGAGKTTVFKILSGDILGTKGTSYIAGKNVATDLNSIRHLIGYCPQFDALLDNLTAREHLELYAAIKGIPAAKREPIIQQILKDLMLKPFENIISSKYSGGNKRKLSVAIALIGNPSIIFLDEPSAGMDPEARRFMWSVISTISSVKKQASIILTTHSMEEAEGLSNKLGIMVEGNLKCIGAPQALKTKYGNGYEVEVKLRLATKPALLQFSGKQDLTDLAQIVIQQSLESIMQSLNVPELAKEISAKGRGCEIFRMFENKQEVSLMIIAEFAYMQHHCAKIHGFLTENFGNVSLLESFQSYFRYKISEGQKLSALFGRMEQNREGLDIAQYSIKQISLEQIFLSLANQAEHDD
jgi:ATP-binding cassette subfamily A (ABC1) protein 3